MIRRMKPLPVDTELAARGALAAYPLTPRALAPITHGLINTTWQVTAADGRQFVLQRLHASFPAEVNLNLERITRHLAAQGHRTPRLCATTDGAWWVTRDDAVWRLLTFVAGETFAAMPGLAHARCAGRMLGEFHAALADFRGPLPCPRPPVHEPARHRAVLAEALARHTDHDLHAEVAALTESIDAASAAVGPVTTRPLRLVHGDPKLSNLLFGPGATPGCLVDLDTLTYAPLAYELGDALRSWCNPQAEDAPRATFDLPIFEAALAGYAEATRDYLLEAEAASIVAATETIHLELAMRFAADALNEAYFAWDPARFDSRGAHNLVRARNQRACAHALATRRDAAQDIADRVFARTARAV